MKNWFNSIRGSVLISSIALIAFIGYVFLEMRYFLGELIPGEAAAMILTIITLLIISGWLRALFVAANGRRAGPVALLVFSLFSALIAVYDM